MHDIIRNVPVILQAYLFEVASRGFTIIIDIFFLLNLNFRNQVIPIKKKFVIKITLWNDFYRPNPSGN